MKPHPRYTALALLALTALSAGCTAQESQLKTAQADVTAAAPYRPYLNNENLQSVYFEAGKSQLDPKSMEALKANVDWLKDNMPSRIQVAGFSDGKGTPEQNLAVGQRRAASLREFYVAMGVPRSRISTITYGQEEPVCFEQTEECQAKNRRADTLIENKELAAR
jgi:peptidoglycan-associated lipoprotein